MTPPNTEQLAEMRAKALRTIDQLPQDKATAIARLYCEIRAEGENQARAEMRTSIEASKLAQFSSVREKNIWVRSGLGIGVDAWFDAHKIVMA